MKKSTIKVISLLICAILLLQLSFSGCTKKEEINLDNGFNTENLSLYEVPDWFRDAKFGIFIHYGVYSVSAYGDEWYGHHMYIPDSVSYGGDHIYDYHKKNYGGADKFGYKDFIPEFTENLKKFDENNMAEKWADLFEKAGAKYVIPVGIHHDSYALYNSDVQKTYNSVSQAGVDYISELQKACKDKEIKFGISNHFVENDWFFDDAYAQGTDLAERNNDGSLVYGELYGDGETKSEAHIHKWYDISMEIINKYNPDIIYYDFDLCNDELNKYEDANRYLMLANYYNHAKQTNPNGVVCCNKNGAFTQAQAVLDKERSSLGDIAPTPWQTDTSIGKKAWGYITNEEYRSADQFIGALVDIVSKNGNLLLNIGPKADGTIPNEVQKTLEGIGKWLSKYGDAIYETRPWFISGEGPTNATDDSFKYQEGDIRFTRSKDRTKVYVTSLAGLSDDTLKVKTLRKYKYDISSIDKISLINGEKREELEWNQTENALEIKIPENVRKEPFSIEISQKISLTKEPYVPIPANKTISASNAYNIVDITYGHSVVDGAPVAVAQPEGGELDYAICFDDFDAGEMWFEVTGDSKGTLTVDHGGLEFKVKPDKNNATQIISSDISYIKKNTDRSFNISLSEGVKLIRFGFNEKRIYNNPIDASNFNESVGSVRSEVTTDKEYPGNSLGYVAAGDNVLYKNVDFGDGCTKLYLRAGADNRSYRVYIDKISKGKMIAQGTISTGGYDNYETIEVDIKETKGKHDVFIEFVDDATNLNWFCISDGNYKP